MHNKENHVYKKRNNNMLNTFYVKITQKKVLEIFCIFKIR